MLRIMTLITLLIIDDRQGSVRLRAQMIIVSSTLEWVIRLSAKYTRDDLWTPITDWEAAAGRLSRVRRLFWCVPDKSTYSSMPITSFWKESYAPLMEMSLGGGYDLHVSTGMVTSLGPPLTPLVGRLPSPSMAEMIFPSFPRFSR